MKTSNAATSKITKDRLCEALSYDQETGMFRWVSCSARNVKNGDAAGTIDSKGYRTIRVDYVVHKAHRLAWLYVYGELPSGVIDHINGDRGDNRIANLRDATHAINCQNVRKANKNNTSGLLGAQKARTKWNAVIFPTVRNTFWADSIRRRPLTQPTRRPSGFCTQEECCEV